MEQNLRVGPHKEIDEWVGERHTIIWKVLNEFHFICKGQIVYKRGSWLGGGWWTSFPKWPPFLSLIWKFIARIHCVIPKAVKGFRIKSIKIVSSSSPSCWLQKYLIAHSTLAHPGQMMLMTVTGAIKEVSNKLNEFITALSSSRLVYGAVPVASSSPRFHFAGRAMNTSAPISLLATSCPATRRLCSCALGK